MPDGRVLIAFDDDALTASPTWTRIDDTNNLVKGIDIRRGRQTELDVTDASTATVYINDTDGRFDPNNTLSPYFGNLDGKQILLQLWNPVEAEWVTQWRGHIDDYGYTIAPSQVLANIQIDCVDLFGYLAGVEMIPSDPVLFGQTPPSDAAPVFYGASSVQERLANLASDAGLPDEMFSFFTGNVDVRGTVYDPGDSLLAAMRDAADAEFPVIANLYTDKLGRVVFHGRYARFDPEGTAVGSDWVFTRWKAGDGAAILGDATRAQIRPPFQWSRPRSMIRNAAICYPRRDADETQVVLANQIYADSVSIGKFGYRSWSAPDLIVLEGTTTGNDDATECLLYATYIGVNFAYPRNRVEALTFKSIHPDDPRADATWALLAGVDISDVIDLDVGYPGSSEGLAAEFYVEGTEMSVRPLNADHDMVELSVNVSPSEYFDDNVFS